MISSINIILLLTISNLIFNLKYKNVSEVKNIYNALRYNYAWTCIEYNIQTLYKYKIVISTMIILSAINICSTFIIVLFKFENTIILNLIYLLTIILVFLEYLIIFKYDELKLKRKIEESENLNKYCKYLQFNKNVPIDDTNSIEKFKQLSKSECTVADLINYEEVLQEYKEYEELKNKFELEINEVIIIHLSTGYDALRIPMHVEKITKFQNKDLVYKLFDHLKSEYKFEPYLNLKMSCMNIDIIKNQYPEYIKYLNKIEKNGYNINITESDKISTNDDLIYDALSINDIDFYKFKTNIICMSNSELTPILNIAFNHYSIPQIHKIIIDYYIPDIFSTLEQDF